MEEGLGEFLDSAGFRSQFEIRPIEQEETCDYFAPDSARLGTLREKGHVRKIYTRHHACMPDHAAEMNQKSEKT